MIRCTDRTDPTAPASQRATTRHPSAAIALAAAVVAPTFAVAYEPQTPLGRIGQTALQQQTGDAVNIVCPQLGALPSRSAAQQDLFDRCGNMVGNAFQIEGIDRAPLAKSLGLTPDQLAGAVQTVANEELASTKTMATDISGAQVNSAIARLSSIRSGVRFSVAGLAIDDFDAYAALDPRLQGQAGSTGGAAGDSLDGKWGFFITGNYGFGDRDGTPREDAFDYDRWGLTAGADYRVTDNLVLGGMVGYSSINSDFDVTPTVAGGGVDADAWGLGVYGTYYVDNFYVDGLVGWNQTDYDIDRRIYLPVGADPGSSSAVVETDRTAQGSTDSSDWTASLGAGMDFNRDNLSYGPFARLTYSQADIDGYSESGAFGLNLTVGDQNWESLTSVLGARISAAFSQGWGVLVPQARLGWVHEFKNDSQIFSAFYTVDPQRIPLLALTDDPDRDYIELGIGVSAVMPGGLQAFLDYQTLLAQEYLTDNIFTLGVRAAF